MAATLPKSVSNLSTFLSPLRLCLRCPSFALRPSMRGDDLARRVFTKPRWFSSAVQYKSASEFDAYTSSSRRSKTSPPPTTSTPISNATNLADGDSSSSHSAWGNASNPASFDLRSDVVTTPTASMLRAIHTCTLLDDVFHEDPTTTSLESLIASLTGHEDALLVLSGTMGNQVALRTHLTAPPHSIVCDRRSHIIQYEAGGVATLSQAMLVPIDASNGKYITLEEIQAYAVLSDDVHACPTKVISLENTLNGMVMPISEVRRISAWARDNGIILHMDGARLWNAAVASGAGTLKEFCQLVDSVSLCFSKGLGAPIGSIIVGNKAFIKRARWIRKSIGGGLRQAGVVAAPARVAVEETFLGGLLDESHCNAKEIERRWTELGGKLKYAVESNMVWLDIEAHGINIEEWMRLGEEYGLRLMGGRLVVHYQVGQEAVERLGQLFRDVLKGEKGALREKGFADGAEKKRTEEEIEKAARRTKVANAV